MKMDLGFLDIYAARCPYKDNLRYTRHGYEVEIW